MSPASTFKFTSLHPYLMDHEYHLEAGIQRTSGLAGLSTLTHGYSPLTRNNYPVY